MNGGLNDATIVTACIDHIKFFENIDPKMDLHL